MAKNLFYVWFWCFFSVQLWASEAADFSFDTGLLNIPIVQVDGAAYYQATLVLADVDNLVFTLQDAVVINTLVTPENPATFDFESNELLLPTVIVGEVTYSAMLELTDSSGPLTFTVTSVQLIKPYTLPTFASVNLYSDESIFNQKIVDTPSIDNNSDVLISALATHGNFVVQVRQYSAPVFFADANTPRADIFIDCGEPWELGVTQLLSVPVPEFAEAAFDTDGAANPPIGCGEDADQDNHMVILDLENRCEYGLWQAKKNGNAWSASWTTGISMDSDGVFPNGFSTRGSGFPFLGGVIWPDELQNGEIKHVLAFNAPLTRAGGPVSPATDTDGNSEDSTSLPEGAIIQMNPDLDLSTLGLTEYEMTIARAMQDYGLILVDTGGAGSLGLYVIDPKSAGADIYGETLPDEDFVALNNIPINSSTFRVLSLPDIDSDFRDNLSIADNGCVIFQ